jgi:hypothetical protein
LKVEIIVLVLIIGLVIISGVNCFSQEDKSASGPAENNDINNANEKLRWEPAFAIVGLLLVTYLVLGRRE